MKPNVRDSRPVTRTSKQEPLRRGFVFKQKVFTESQICTGILINKNQTAKLIPINPLKSIPGLDKIHVKNSFIYGFILRSDSFSGSISWIFIFIKTNKACLCVREFCCFSIHRVWSRRTTDWVTVNLKPARLNPKKKTKQNKKNPKKKQPCWSSCCIFPDNTSHWNGNSHLGDLCKPLTVSQQLRPCEPRKNPGIDRKSPLRTHGIIDKDSHSGWHWSLFQNHWKSDLPAIVAAAALFMMHTCPGRQRDQNQQEL